MTVKANIIWKRVHPSHSLFIDDTGQHFVATFTTPTTTGSWPFRNTQSGWDSCHVWFASELHKLGIRRQSSDIVGGPTSGYGRPSHWPNGDSRTRGES